MRKSLPKTPHSELSSGAASLPARLLAGVGGRRSGVKANGSAAAALRGGRRVSGSVAPLAARETSHAERARLLEGFLGRTELDDSALYGLRWLGDVLHVERSLCLTRLPGETTLVTAAAHGLPPS